MASVSASAQAALRHLKTVKPLDGWSIERKSENNSKQVRLLRRNVPLTDNYFLDIHYDNNNNNNNSASESSKQIVGILTPPRSSDGRAQAQVLVDADGVPVGHSKIELVRVVYSVEKSSSSTVSVSRTSPTRAATNNNIHSMNNNNNNNNNDTISISDLFSNPENQQFLQYGLAAVGGIMALRIIFSALFSVLLLIVPLLYLYLASNCPTEASFDAKKELKRVLRGDNLPPDHPDKPKGFFNETLARINATLTAEVATGLGYEVTMIPVMGAAWISKVRVPAVGQDLYWAGLNHRWFYITAVKIEQQQRD